MKQPKQEWTEEFDKRYVDTKFFPPSKNTPIAILIDDIKTFISILLLSQRKEVIDEIIEEVIYQNTWNKRDDGVNEIEEGVWYIKKDDILQSLNKLK